jgi:uncharacterized damage-inducible protein DinB
MTIAQGMLPELDQELANTRKILERVPDDRLEYRPHPKSWALGALATHVATLPGWTPMTIGRAELDIAPVGQGPMRVPEAKTSAELLSRFDENAAAARASLAAASDATMLGPWTLLAGGHTVFTLPRVAVMRTFVMNHLIHHRAQLGVYLRLCDVPLPNLYGPTADESGM